MTETNDEDTRFNLSRIMKLIRDSVDDDNLIKEEEFQKIQDLKKELSISNDLLRSNNEDEFKRILHLQLYLLLLDDQIDLAEKEELKFYQRIFGYSEQELVQLAGMVKEEKDDWNSYKARGFKPLD